MLDDVNAGVERSPDALGSVTVRGHMHAMRASHFGSLAHEFHRKVRFARTGAGRQSATGCDQLHKVSALSGLLLNRISNFRRAGNFNAEEMTMPARSCKRRSAGQNTGAGDFTALDHGAESE